MAVLPDVMSIEGGRGSMIAASWTGTPIPTPPVVHGLMGDPVSDTYSSSCRICKNKLAPDVLNLSLQGMTAAGIARLYEGSQNSPKDAPITERVVRNHIKNHIDKASARIADSFQGQADMMGGDPDTVPVDLMTYAREMIQRSWLWTQRNKNWVPSFKDVVPLLAIIADHERETRSGIDPRITSHVISAMMVQAQRALPPVLYEAWMEGVQGDPIVSAIVESERRKALVGTSLPGYVHDEQEMEPSSS